MMINKKICVALLCFMPPLSFALDLTVSQDGSGHFTTIQEAVSAIASLPDTTPKFDSGNSEACFFGRGQGGVLSTRVVASGASTSWLTDIAPGDLIALNGTDNWYEVSEVINNSALNITREDDGDEFRCGAYSVVEMNFINLNPGVYSQETIDMTDAHFVTFRGTSIRGASVIEGNDGIDSNTGTGIGYIPAIENFPPFFNIKFDTLSIHSREGSTAIELGFGTPNRVLEFNNVEYYSYAADLMHGQPGHLIVKDSLFTGWWDGLNSGIYAGVHPVAKSFTVSNSKIIMMPQNYLGGTSPATCFSYDVIFDSIIENSEFSCQNYSKGIWIRNTNGAVVTIKNTNVSVVGKGGSALYLANTTSASSQANIVLENVIIESDVLVGTDITLKDGGSVSAACTSTGNPLSDPLVVDTSQGGTFIDMGCN